MLSGVFAIISRRPRERSQNPSTTGKNRARDGEGTGRVNRPIYRNIWRCTRISIAARVIAPGRCVRKRTRANRTRRFRVTSTIERAEELRLSILLACFSCFNTLPCNIESHSRYRLQSSRSHIPLGYVFLQSLQASFSIFLIRTPRVIFTQFVSFSDFLPFVNTELFEYFVQSSWNSKRKNSTASYICIKINK